MKTTISALTCLLLTLVPVYRANADDDMETRLQKKRMEAAELEVNDREKLMILPRGMDRPNQFALFDAQRRLIAAQLDFYSKPKEIIDVLEKHVEIARRVERTMELQSREGKLPRADSIRAKYFRAGAELKLLRAKRKFMLVGDKDKKQPETDDDIETKLLDARIRVVKSELNDREKLINLPRGMDFPNLLALFDAQRRLIAAQLDFHKKPKEIIFVLEKYVENARRLAAVFEALVAGGVGESMHYEKAKYFRADAELKLLRAERKYMLVGDDADMETKLLEYRIRTVEREIEIRLRLSADRGMLRSPQPLFDLFDAQQRLIAAQLDFHDKPKKIISLLEEYVENARALEASLKRVESVGTHGKLYYE